MKIFTTQLKPIELMERSVIFLCLTFLEAYPLVNTWSESTGKSKDVIDGYRYYSSVFFIDV